MDRIVIVGGGIVGSCTAYFLGALGYPGEVVVLERDPLYRTASTTLSAASIRTQFTLPLNVRMSLFGARFLEQMAALPGVDLALVHSGYLVVAGEAGADSLRAAWEMQRAEGAEIALLDPADLVTRFPWLNAADLAAATLGLRHEGWFDAHALLRAVRAEVIRLGARYLHDEAVALELAGPSVESVRTRAGERIACRYVVNAAGPAAGDVAALAGIPLPVEPRKRTVFVLRAPLKAANMPLIFDTSGAWIRPEGEGFIAGIAPPADRDPRADGDFEPDMALLEESLWPALAHRVPALERLRVQRAWAGHYELCTLDHNAVIGPHPEIGNFLMANGFSGHGVQHAPAAGRGLAELISHGGYRSLDLSPFGYGRVREGRRMPELAIY
jgi:FAD-dependent oxidoreductase domain-containing protein 1